MGGGKKRAKLIHIIRDRINDHDETLRFAGRMDLPVPPGRGYGPGHRQSSGPALQAPPDLCHPVMPCRLASGHAMRPASEIVLLAVRKLVRRALAKIKLRSQAPQTCQLAGHSQISGLRLATYRSRRDSGANASQTQKYSRKEIDRDSPLNAARQRPADQAYCSIRMSVTTAGSADTVAIGRTPWSWMKAPGSSPWSNSTPHLFSPHQMMVAQISSWLT